MTQKAHRRLSQDSRLFIPVQPMRHIHSDSQRVRAVHPQQPPYPVRAQATYQPPRPQVIQPAPRVYPARPMPNVRPQAAPQPRPVQPPRTRPTSRAITSRTALWLVLGGGVLFTMMLCGMLTLGFALVMNNGVLPGVQVAGVSLSGLSEQEAAALLQTELAAITLRDGERTWSVPLESLGLRVDAAATFNRAYAQGRGEGDVLSAIFGSQQITPVFTIDEAALLVGIDALRPQIDLPAQNAGVRLVNGQIEAVPPAAGRRLDVVLTAQRFSQPDALVEGTLDVVMQTVPPTVTDSSAMVEAAARLLANPLVVRVYDPVTGDSVDWVQTPEVWATWITSQANPASPTGLSLSLEVAPLRAFLTERGTVLDSSRYLKLDEAVTQIQGAISENRTTATVRVYHHERQHTVQSGETISSIAWNYGVPYPWLQQANPGLESLTVGQSITIPSPDTFLPYDPVPNKRIVVSISQQRAWVYENGATIWEWPVSTGIDSSPTWPGVYQILSHEPNAYAANWDLWMPQFMGVYQPIPQSAFTNGFHGFPTRGGGQILWENSLGRKVTYGCILLSNTNAQLLYDWAETGVVVEIRA
ncbi:MAG: hypothetical protein OHK0046_36670 [Anaerolineae bacterium]